MNRDRDDHHGDADRDARELERDRLIDRLVDGEATAGDWARVSNLADLDRGFWAKIAERQADREALSAAVEEAIAVADGVDLDPRAAWSRENDHAGRSSLRVWGGWVAAAAVLLFATLNGRIPLPEGGAGPETGGAAVGVQQAGVALPDLSPAELLDRYLEAGRDAGSIVHAEEPVVLSARPAAENADQLEVLVVRQIVERRYVSSVPRLMRNELGEFEATTVPASVVTRPRPTY